jgi:hypothetical protein
MGIGADTAMAQHCRKVFAPLLTEQAAALRNQALMPIDPQHWNETEGELAG